MLADDQLLAEFNFNDSSSESDSDDTSRTSITLEDSSEEGSACSIMNFTDEEYQEAYALGEYIRSQTNPNKRQKVGNSREDTRPIAFIRLNIRQGKPKAVTLKALFDTGASESVITKEYAKKLRQRQNDKRVVWCTPGGDMTTNTKVKTIFTIPELHEKKVIEWEFHVTPLKMGAHDVMLGRDIMTFLGIDPICSREVIEWDGLEMPWKSPDATVQTDFHAQESMAVHQSADRIQEILDAKYEAADLKQVCADQEHLTEEEQQMLLQLLTTYEDLFDGTLGKWTQDPIKLELIEGATPYHARPYPIPKCHEATLRQEVERLCRIGVLKKVNRSEWASPSFIILKKDGTVRFINDFRELNKRIRRKPYPIPHIQDMLLNLEGFMCATSLDLNMGYYHIELCPESKRLCTLVFPFGKFEMQQLPMGLCNSPDIFQEKMSELMEGLNFVRTYIDDLLVLTKGSFEDHLEKLERALARLRLAGLKVNAKKSFFAKSELEYLGYWITREGIKPLTDKVQAIMRIAEPTNRKELRSFIGIVNYYRDMWIRRSHVLAPLASLTSKKVKWE